jgi:protein-S-isoprenylcysteine O-methyltransferase Ste14
MEQKRRVVPPVYLLMSLVSMTLLHTYFPIAQVAARPYSYAGAVLMVIGIGMAGYSAFSFDRAGTPVVPFEPSTALVTGGFYRITRNPMYLGMVLLLLGFAMFLGTLGAFLPIPVFVLIIQEWFIKGEERFLEEIFGEQYVAFKKRVGRWI